MKHLIEICAIVLALVASPAFANDGRGECADCDPITQEPQPDEDPHVPEPDDADPIDQDPVDPGDPEPEPEMNNGRG